MAIKISGTTVIDDSRIATLVSATFTGNTAVGLTSGTTAERPAVPTSGMIRFNSTTKAIEYYSGTEWTTTFTGIGAKLYFMGTLT